MKTYIKNNASRLAFIAIPLLTLFCSSCSKDELEDQSIISVDKVDYTPFDYWLQRNYVAPYNIEFKYRYDDKESDMNYYTIPARYEASVILAHLVKYLCIEAYDEVAGVDFTRAYFPKMIFTIGEWEYRNNGTFILGTAEGGRKILLSGTNYVEQYMGSAEALNEYYLRTIHHEFTHILNQTKDYPTDFKLVTGSSYVADSWSEGSLAVDFLPRGFITNYAQHSDTEDFAEMMSMYICSSEATWAAYMAEAGEVGEPLITAKLDMVKDYMLTSYNIDLDKLRASIQRRQKDVIEGRVDLTDLTVN